MNVSPTDTGLVGSERPDENELFALRKAFEMLDRGVAEGWVDLTAHDHLQLDFDAIRETLKEDG